MTFTHQLRRAHGFSILESVFAMGVLTIVALGLLPLGMMASNTTENQGHLVARATEYTQDKMEQLLALAYDDQLTDTRVFPSADTGGSGLAIGGSADPSAPVTLYVDYLDIDGTLLPSVNGAVPANWYYKRVWKVETPSNKLKKVTVTTIVKGSVGRIGQVPRATLMAVKTSPF